MIPAQHAITAAALCTNPSPMPLDEEYIGPDGLDMIGEMLFDEMLLDHGGQMIPLDPEWVTTPDGPVLAESMVLDFPVRQAVAPEPEDIDMDALRVRYGTWGAGGRPGWNQLWDEENRVAENGEGDAV